MSTATKDARLDLRMTVAQRDLIERAAAVSGSTVTGFAVARLVEQARQEVERSKTVLLDPDEWDAFIAILDAPEDPVWRDLMASPMPWEHA